MRKYIFSVLIALLSLPVIAQQQQSQAKVILDKTAEAFRKAGGVKADFTVKAVANGLVEGAENGTIQLKGEKFVLKTSDIITWFDGKTQWSYVTKNDEVNVSNPTQEELQQINPYTFLYMYQKGFSYKSSVISAGVLIRQHWNRKMVQEKFCLFVWMKLTAAARIWLCFWESATAGSQARS